MCYKIHFQFPTCIFIYLGKKIPLTVIKFPICYWSRFHQMPLFCLLSFFFLTWNYKIDLRKPSIFLFSFPLLSIWLLTFAILYFTFDPILPTFREGFEFLFFLSENNFFCKKKIWSLNENQSSWKFRTPKMELNDNLQNKCNFKIENWITNSSSSLSFQTYIYRGNR